MKKGRKPRPGAGGSPGHIRHDVGACLGEGWRPWEASLGRQGPLSLLSLGGSWGRKEAVRVDVLLHAGTAFRSRYEKAGAARGRKTSV